MASLSQTWKDLENSLVSKKSVKIFSILFTLALLFFGVRACSAFLNPETPVYTIAKDPNWYPLQLYNKENNVTAFSNDLIFAIATDLGLKIHLTTASQQNLFESLHDGNVDGVLSSITPDLIAKGSYLFSDPYYTFGSVIVVRSDSGITSLKDLQNKIIAVNRGSSVLFHLQVASSIIITPYDSPTYILNELMLNRIDAVIMDQFTAYAFLSEFFRNKLKVASLPITNEGLRLVTLKNKKGEELIKEFNEGLRLLKENGTYESLLKKWDLNY